MMKKFLLASALLCLLPFVIVHAENITREHCDNWISESRDNNILPELMQTALQKQNNLKQWTSGIPSFELELTNVCKEVSQTEEKSPEESRLLQKTTLLLQNTIQNYKTLETRERMPFVHDGDVLPGPSTEEDGSYYVEQRFIPKFVNGTLVFLISLSVLMVIVGGLMFLFSSGDSDLTARAKTTIIWSIVGVIITLLAYAIVQFVIGIDFGL